MPLCNGYGMLSNLTNRKFADTKPTMPKPYQQKETSDKKRYVICAVDKYLPDSCKGDNLTSDEIKIVSVQAIGCPIKSVCTDIDSHGRTTYCVHLTAYPFMITGDKLLGESLSCAKARKVLDARELKPETCPIKRRSCIACEHLGDIFLRSQRIDKSHAHIKCEGIKNNIS